MACRDARARADHHCGLAAIEAIHKDTGSTLRYIVLAFPALPNMLTHECSLGSFLLLCSASGIASQSHHRRAERPRPAALVAGVLGPATCSLWRLSSARGRVEVSSCTVIKFRAKWRATGRDAAALCGPQTRCPCMGCSSKVWAHATRRLERSGGAAEGERRPWKRARAPILAGVIDGDDGVGLTVRFRVTVPV